MLFETKETNMGFWLDTLFTVLLFTYWIWAPGRD